MRVLVIEQGRGQRRRQDGGKWDLFEHVGVADYDVSEHSRRSPVTVTGSLPTA